GMLMRRVKGGSSRAIVSAGGGPLKVWQKGYHDRAIRREEDVLKAARYIVANPLRAGLVTNVGDFPFLGRCRRIVRCRFGWLPYH
ncbi:transposase, partial [Pseudomonas viridiflava]|uniref:transposase n=1 Tax=Pseudomonas viridiflava TaxID=33069 RepID=UPI003C12FA06